MAEAAFQAALIDFKRILTGMHFIHMMGVLVSLPVV
jgi:hypothetical protein